MDNKEASKYDTIYEVFLMTLDITAKTLIESELTTEKDLYFGLIKEHYANVLFGLSSVENSNIFNINQKKILLTYQEDFKHHVDHIYSKILDHTLTYEFDCYKYYLESVEILRRRHSIVI